MSALTATKSDIVTVNNVAAYVYVDATGATVNGEVGEYIYIPNKDVYNTYPAVPGGAAAHIEVNGIVNGQTVALSFAAGNGITIGGSGSQSFSNVAVKTLYEVVAKDANGVITSIKPVATVNGINVAAGGVLSVGSTPDVYTYDNSTVVYYFDENGNCSVMDGSGLAVDATDKVSVVADTDKFATAVYVQQVVSNTATASDIKYSVDGGVATPAGGTSGTVNVTPDSGSAGKTVAITSVTVAPGATYTVSGTAVVQTNGTAATAANTIVITVTAEDGVTSSQITLTLSLIHI